MERGLLEHATFILGACVELAHQSGPDAIEDVTGYEIGCENDDATPGDNMTPESAAAVAEMLVGIYGVANNTECPIDASEMLMIEDRDHFRYFIPAENIQQVERMLLFARSFPAYLTTALKGLESEAQTLTGRPLAIPAYNEAAAKGLAQLLTALGEFHVPAYHEDDVRMGTNLDQDNQPLHLVVVGLQAAFHIVKEEKFAERAAEAAEVKELDPRKEKIVVESLALLRRLMDKERELGLDPQRN